MTQPTPPSVDHMRYDLLVQEALKGVVRKVLVDTARDGLMGDHHFYITFRTEFPGVRLSQRMREKYPEEMTVVLQHQFWDLAVTEYAFEVGLSFGGVPERLLVPFDAVVGFFDPSVQFGLKFELHGELTQLQPEPETAPAAPPPSALPKPQPATRPLKGAGTEPTEIAAPPATEGDAGRDDGDEDGEKRSAQVLSLDAFRKKP